MAVKTYKPTSPGRRDMTGHSFEEITRVKARAFSAAPSEQAGRAELSWQDHGAPSRWRTQAAYRVIDFKRDKLGIAAQSGLDRV